MGTKMEVESGMWQTAHQTAWWVDWDQVTLASRARVFLMECPQGPGGMDQQGKKMGKSEH